MGDILGIGTTHYPPGLVPEQYKPWPLARMLHSDPRIPEHLRNPASWPEPMRAEWGADEGITSFKAHRERVFSAFRTIRDEIAAFQPDFILMWGEPGDKTFTWPGQPAAGRFLASRLLEAGVDMPYAYRPLHGDGVAHAFANTLLYLDLDRRGFSYPVLPVTVNCYGRDVIRYQGGGTQHTDEADPPAPAPRRCFELGRLTARILRESPWRVVLMASSSWSHAFLTAKNHFLYPDLEADRVLLEHLRAGDYETWRDLPLERLEASGQHEVLNWVCLAGAMAEVGAKMELVDWIETWIFNAPKCQAIFR